jgi:CheY-like chemotaxis protein
MRDTIGNMLTSFGYSVVIRKNGRDVVDYIASSIRADQTLSGIIFDLTVPGDMGGKAAIEEIRKLTVKTPVFIVSGYADDPVMRHPAEYGFTASICKPFRKVDLSNMLNNYL